MWTPDEAVTVGFLDEVAEADQVLAAAASHAAELAGRLQPDAYQESASLLSIIE
jgi:enoyl-CoA hydratase/carnithine racemase